MDIKKKIENFPLSCGVYLMKDKTDRIIYVGKASSLKKRVSSYFQRPATVKAQRLLEQIAQIDYIQTSSAAQALLLENALIKQHQPYYNAALKDDKTYPYVYIGASDDYPCVLITRGERTKPGHYFGPYTSVKLLKAAIKDVRAVFPFRSCLRLKKRPCLYFHLKLCPGVCAQKIDKDLYQQNLRQLELFLEGRHNELLEQLKDKMNQAAKNESFEQAAELRDRIDSLSQIIAQGKEPSRGDLILDLQKLLNLTRPPYRIEAFDISQISGQYLSGAMVSFLRGWPQKSNYRKFAIKTVKGVDDYAMIKELLQRRYGRDRHRNMPQLPDLVMIDGGKGHLECAQRQLRLLGYPQLAVVALAKQQETIYTWTGEIINLPEDSKLLHLLQRIRDEVHRFAISYHRQLRAKSMHQSFLDEIKAIGPKRKKALLRYFKSVEAIKEATLEDLLKVKGISRGVAENIIRNFKSKG